MILVDSSVWIDFFRGTVRPKANGWINCWAVSRC